MNPDTQNGSMDDFSLYNRIPNFTEEFLRESPVMWAFSVRENLQNLYSFSIFFLRILLCEIKCKHIVIVHIIVSAGSSNKNRQSHCTLFLTKHFHRDNPTTVPNEAAKNMRELEKVHGKENLFPQNSARIFFWNLCLWDLIKGPWEIWEKSCTAFKNILHQNKLFLISFFHYCFKETSCPWMKKAEP